jgi:hypothetical protein
MLLRATLCLAVLSISVRAQTADEIMAKVAANQDRSVEARERYVYNQEVLVRIKRTNGKLSSEETRLFTVTPTGSGFSRKLTQVSGKRVKGKQEIPYHEPGSHEGIDVDGVITEAMAEDIGSDKESRDGVSAELFPLTSERADDYQFRLAGKDRREERDVYRVEFKPKKKKHEDMDDDACWEGEAVIDANEFQPLEVTSHLACKVPLLIKTAMGTNIEHLGFKVNYRKFDDQVWFPVDYGGEFKVRVLFFYARRVSFGLRNSDFKRATADSTIEFESQ